MWQAAVPQSGGRLANEGLGAAGWMQGRQRSLTPGGLGAQRWVWGHLWVWVAGPGLGNIRH